MSATTNGNQLLARLPKASYSRLKGHLIPVTFESGQLLYEARSAVEFAYFPTHGTLSAVVVMLDGSTIEVATIGNEGAVGIPMLMTAEISPNRVFCQVPGDGLRIELARLNAETERDAAMRRVLALYHTAYLFQISQSVACNGLHSLLPRCCRWLLMTHDRVSGSNVVNLTHEFLATMLGVRRSSVTETLQALKEEGLIDYSRGKITIEDRKGLEASSCECYRAVQDEYARLLR
jgi:CRP-like cAMP-binding protein